MPATDTLDPNSTSLLAGAFTIVGGAGSLHAAVSDASDATYIYPAGPTANIVDFGLNASWPPDTDVYVLTVRVNIRMRRRSGSDAGRVLLQLRSAFGNTPLREAITVSDSFVDYPVTVGAVLVAGSVQTIVGYLGNGAPYDSMVLEVVGDKTLVADIAEIEVEAEYAQAPTLTLDSSPDQADTGLPQLTWSLVDPLDSSTATSRYVQVVFVPDGTTDGEGVAAGAAGFDPLTSGQTVLRGTRQLVYPTQLVDALANGDWYAYVRAALSGADYDDPIIYSAWDEISFTVDKARALWPPQVSAAVENSNGLVRLTVVSAANRLAQELCYMRDPIDGWQSAEDEDRAGADWTDTHSTGLFLSSSSGRIVGANGETAHGRLTSSYDVELPTGDDVTHVTVAVEMRANTSAEGDVQLGLRFLDGAGGSAVATGSSDGNGDDLASAVTVSSSTQQTLTHTAQIPLGATHVSPVLKVVDDAGGSGYDLSWEAMQLAAVDAAGTAIYTPPAVDGTAATFGDGGGLIAASHYIEVEYSADGQVTWQRASLRPVLNEDEGQVEYVLSDLESGFGGHIRARSVATFVVTANVIDPLLRGEQIWAGEWCDPIAVTQTLTSHFLGNPTDGSEPVALGLITEHTFGEVRPVDMFDPPDDDWPVITIGESRGDSGRTAFTTTTKADWDALRAVVDTRGPLLYRDLLGRKWYMMIVERPTWRQVRAGPAESPYAVSHRHDAAIPWRQVRPPAPGIT